MPRNNEREYRTMAVMTAKRAEGEAPTYRVEGYATTFDEPYLLYEYGSDKLYECIDRHAFDECDMSDCIMQYDHAGMVYARTRNGSLQLEVDDHGLKITADLSLTEESRKLWDAIDKGLVDRMSFCFTVDEDKYNEKTQTDTITVIRKIYDVSAVSIPANPGTEIGTARKAMLDGEIERLRTERSAKARRAKQARILRLRMKLKSEE